jgi:hypothetical protein
MKQILKILVRELAFIAVAAGVVGGIWFLGMTLFDRVQFFMTGFAFGLLYWIIQKAFKD